MGFLLNDLDLHKTVKERIVCLFPAHSSFSRKDFLIFNNNLGCPASRLVSHLSHSSLTHHNY